MPTLSIAKDFSPTPGGRFRRHGRFSGEEFREDFLLPAVANAQQRGEVLSVSFDNVAGLPSSFLEEAFGGLVRRFGKSALEIIEPTAHEASLLPYVELARRYMREAAASQ